jgi:hypothetical protein
LVLRRADGGLRGVATARSPKLITFGDRAVDGV